MALTEPPRSLGNLESGTSEIRTSLEHLGHVKTDFRYSLKKPTKNIQKILKSLLVGPKIFKK